VGIAGGWRPKPEIAYVEEATVELQPQGVDVGVEVRTMMEASEKVDMERVDSADWGEWFVTGEKEGGGVHDSVVGSKS
jgi:hypothetical protein